MREPRRARPEDGRRRELPSHSRVLVVLGMHRSGTSVVTHWLHECGLPVGDALLGAGVGNVQGHFEDLDLYRLQRGWLEANGLPHTGYVDAPVPPLSDGQRRDLHRLVATRSGRFAQWGWKEPRTCLFLDEHRAALPDARYLVLYRDPAATVSSLILRYLHRRDEKYRDRNVLERKWWFGVRRQLRFRRLLGHDAERLLRVWIFYNREILRCLGELDPSSYLVARVDVLARDDGRAVFDALTRRWGFRLRRVGFRAIYRAGLQSAPLDLSRQFDPALQQQARRLQAQLAELADRTAPPIAAHPLSA